MTRVSLLSEEDGEQEKQSRDNRIAAEQKLDGLMAHRRDLFMNVRRISEEIMDLQRRRQMLNGEVQTLHEGFKELGVKQRSLREERGRILDRLDDLTETLYQRKSNLPEGGKGGYRRLGVEIAALERAQQTKVMSLKDENALIERTRQLRQQLVEAEKVEAKWMAEEATASGLKKDIEDTRKKLTQVVSELDKIRLERDEQMAKVKAQLGEIGHVLTEIRAKGQVRTETLDKVKALGEEIAAMGKKVLDMTQESRSRANEARRSFKEHSDAVRHRFSSDEARDRSAEESLSSLFKNGKIELGMDNEVSGWANPNASRRKRG